MKGLYRSALRKALSLIALWLLLMILLPAGTLPVAYARPARAPADFGKIGPLNGSTGQPLTVTLEWSASVDATSYEYCYDTTNNDTCNSWTSTTSTSAVTNTLAEYQVYYWHVRAINATGTTYSDASTVFWSFTTGGKPGTFSKNTPASNAAAQPLNLNLTWSASQNVSTYEYCLDTVNNGTCDMAGGWFDVGNVTSFAVGPLSPATIYYWHVRANNAFGTTYSGGAATTFRLFTTLGPPGAFGKSTPTNGAGGQSYPNLTLTWGASADAASYEYCIDNVDNNTCDGTWTSTGTTLSASLTNLGPGTTYYWQVRAINGIDTTYADGLDTAFWSFTTGTPPGSFSKSTPTDGASNQLLNTSLTWGASSGATSYQYCIDTSNDGACGTGWVSTGTARTASPSLNAGVTYYWQVRAINTFGTTYAGGSAAAYWDFTTGSAPGAFSKTSPSNGAANQPPALDLVWGTSTNADTYEYCYDTTNDDACTPWTSTTATSASLTNLTAGVTYYWHVRAINAYGTTYSNGFAVNDWSFTIGSAPGAFGKTSPAAGATDQSINPTLQWGNSSNFTRYEYCYDTSNNGACDDIWRNAGSLTSVAIGPLLENTPYSWQVRAVNAYGITYANGSDTAFRAFTTGTLPGAFNKTSPANNAINRQVNLTLTWGTSTGATEYFYCLDVSTALCDATWVSAGTQTSAPVSLDPSTTYYWHVRATNNAGTTYSGGSDSAFFTFTTGSPPAAFGKTSPANLAENVSLNPTLTWGTSTGAGSYAYCYDTTNNNSCDATWINVGASTSEVIGPLLAGTTYYWQVRAINSIGITYSDGASTAWWSFTTTPPPPGAFAKTSPPNTLTVARPLNTSLAWGASANVAVYEYCLATTKAACTNWKPVGSARSVIPGGLSPSTIYYWHVRAVNEFGVTYSNGSSTAFWYFITGAVCPSITGWKGEYWRNETLTGPAVFCGNESALFLDRDFGYNAPAPKIPKDHFSARWTRIVNFPTGGLYRFYVDHDDGARLYIDGVLIRNMWDTCCRTDPANVTLTAGNHTLRLDYHEATGAANIHIWWEQLNAQFLSTASLDGWVLESTETSGVGGSINASSTTFFLGDDAADRQYRSILSFNTSGLPDNAVITSAILKIRGAGVVGTDPFNTHGKILGDVRLGVFGGSASLQAGDFQAGSNRDGILILANTPSNGWYSGSFAPPGLGYINRKGSTQLRLRFQLDDNDDRSADYMKFYSGNYSTATARPLLIIVYYLP